MADSLEVLRRKLSRGSTIEIEPGILGDSSVRKIASQLIPVVARRMGRRAEDVCRCLKRVGLDDTLWIYGRTVSEDEWQTFEINLSAGLLLFHYKMVKLFVSRMNIIDDDNEIVEETQISNDEILSIAKHLLEEFWRGDASKEHFFRSPDISLPRLTKGQFELAAYLLHYADTFVLAHEFGHVLMKANSERVKRERLIVEGAKESMVRPVLNVQMRNSDASILQRWTDEIAADFIGVGLCKELGGNKAQEMVISASAVMSLLMCDMVEKFYRKLTGTNWDYKTHPPSDLRLNILQTLSDWGADPYLGVSFRKFSDYILARI